ncbi:hypothetical protein CC80DRAFT_442327, partial [Byssothecium circinans]
MMSGRGGAGNILRAREQSQKATEDVEANQLPTSSTAHPATSTPTNPLPSNADQDYAHTGRGGAGNWYQPSELSKTGTFTSAADTTSLPTSEKPQISTPWHPEAQEMPVAKAGRGGAGNFVWGSGEEAEKRREEERRVREEVGGRVARDVEAGLAKPPGALLG